MRQGSRECTSRREQLPRKKFLSLTCRRPLLLPQRRDSAVSAPSSSTRGHPSYPRGPTGQSSDLPPPPSPRLLRMPPSPPPPSRRRWSGSGVSFWTPLRTRGGGSRGSSGGCPGRAQRRRAVLFLDSHPPACCDSPLRPPFCSASCVDEACRHRFLTESICTRTSHSVRRAVGGEQRGRQRRRRRGRNAPAPRAARRAAEVPGAAGSRGAVVGDRYVYAVVCLPVRVVR